jgi:hypothetical protein
MIRSSLVILFLFLFTEGFSQETFLVKGVIFHDEHKQRLENVTIKNLNTTETIQADVWGTFSIQASIGDTLLFQKERFRDIAKIITAKQNLVLYLKPSLILDEVVVQGKSRGAEQKEILQGYRGKGVYFNGNPPLLFSLFHPLTAIHELLSKDANDAKRFVNYISRENAQSAVDQKFNPALIAKHIPIDEKDIAEFMFYYRPKPDQIVRWNDYDTIKYIKDAYQKYLKEYKN